MKLYSGSIVSVCLCLACFVYSPDTTARSTSGSPPFEIDEVLSLDTMQPRGKSWKATVPDTLDLAERARLSINVLTRNVEPTKFYGVYQGFKYDSEPPELWALTWNITPKNARTLSMLRVMNGSDFNLDVDYGMMKALMSEIREDGQMYYPFDGSSPPSGTSYPQTNAIVVFAMLHHYQQSGNRAWLKWIDLMCRGLRSAAIEVEDRAYYPMQSGIAPDGSWHFMLGVDPVIAYKPPDEPTSDQQGHEGAAKSDQARHISALLKHYELTGDEASLEMARKVHKFCIKPEMWVDTSDEGYPGNEHGIWGGHVHNNMECLNAFLDLSMVDRNDWLKQFVREGYDHGVRTGVLRIGWFPAWVTPWKYERPRSLHQMSEPCGIADMVVLGVRLSDAGLGDYWDDVDYIVRNHLVGEQVTSLEQLREAVRTLDADDSHDDMRERFVGGFINSKCTMSYVGNTLPGCCSVNGAQGIYYAWHGITRYSRGVATVNMFLNRASAWMDIDSHLPYEGKVVMKNKQAHTVLVRIPSWVEKDSLQCFVNDHEVKGVMVGSRMMIQGLGGGDVIRVQFPVVESIDEYTVGDVKYRFEFRGSTVVDVEPREDHPHAISLFNRGHLTGKRASMRRVERFAADKLVPLGAY